MAQNPLKRMAWRSTPASRQQLLRDYRALQCSDSSVVVFFIAEGLGCFCIQLECRFEIPTPSCNVGELIISESGHNYGLYSKRSILARIKLSPRETPIQNPEIPCSF